MGIVNAETGTRIDEVADSIYRISTPVPPSVAPGGFSFNQYLLVDEEPLLFHTGMRKLFSLVHKAIESVLPLSRLRWVAFGHVEADECGSFRELMAAAPAAQPLCGRLQAMLAIGDLTDKPAKVLGDGETHSLGKRRVTWFDAPHVPHGWDNGFLFETETRTLFSGDLFTQPGDGAKPLVESDILEPSEAFRARMDYYSLGPNTAATIGRVAACAPTTLACMHGSAWRGDGQKLLEELARRLQPRN